MKYIVFSIACQGGLIAVRILPERLLTPPSQLQPSNDSVFIIKIEFTPTIPHCTLATLIGLLLLTPFPNNRIAENCV